MVYCTSQKNFNEVPWRFIRRQRQLLFQVPVTLQSTQSEKAQQLGAKVVTCSDSTGWVYDPEGIDVALLKEIKEVKRARLTEYARRYRPKRMNIMKERGVWSVKVDLALPCATQNELHLEDAKQLVANGCVAVCEGANMPTTY